VKEHPENSNFVMGTQKADSTLAVLQLNANIPSWNINKRSYSGKDDIKLRYKGDMTYDIMNGHSVVDGRKLSWAVSSHLSVFANEKQFHYGESIINTSIIIIKLLF
jgi:hypothetical protein